MKAIAPAAAEAIIGCALSAAKAQQHGRGAERGEKQAHQLLLQLGAEELQARARQHENVGEQPLR